MSNDTGYSLNSVNVVVTAEFHNPSIINPDFLRSKGIVPEDWNVVETVTSPVLSMIRYENGITWTVEQSKLTVAENCMQSFQDIYLAHSLACGYLRTLPHVPYRSLGLNCTILKPVESAENWLTDRFLKPGSWKGRNFDTLFLLPRFLLRDANSTWILSFEIGRAEAQDGNSSTAVIVQINIHHEGPLDSEDMCSAIGDWPDKQNLLASTMDKLLQK